MIKGKFDKTLLILLVAGLTYNVQGQFSEIYYLDSDYNQTDSVNFDILYKVKQLGHDIKVQEYYNNDSLRVYYFYYSDSILGLTTDNFFNHIKTKNLILDGTYYKYDKKGLLYEESTYDIGKLVLGPYNPTNPDTSEFVYIINDDSYISIPEFKSDIYKSFREYIDKNLNYPEEAINKNIQGKVYVDYVVNSKGKVVKVKIARGVNDLLDKEALRVIKNSPTWIPGKYKGTAVSNDFTTFILFEIDKDK